MEDILPKGYEPKNVEDKWYSFWLEKNYFKANENSNKPPFSMVIPPPNVTGSLHMGHALNNTIQDILARYKRMCGYEVLWLPGTDHAGIATQNVVERLIAKEGQTRHTLGRKKFIQRVWKWKEESGTTIIKQLKKLGASCDWSRERFTMDEGLSQAVKQVFLTLFKEGIIERDKRLINWCSRCGTALSDLEVEYEEKDGNLFYIKYPVEDGSYLTVATTRPETMLGDTAVAVNPADERFKHYIGKSVILPIVNRKIPVIADSMVDIEFGTGAVKITPAHDFADEAVGRRHGLPFVSVIDREGKMNGPIPEEYQNLDKLQARTKIIDDLKNSGLLLKVEPIKHNVGHCYRCKEVVEPLLTLQWFVRIESLAKPAYKAVKDGKISIIPENWANTYYQWMENIQDWCISRQIWWGHQIPVYYCSHCDGDKIFITLRPNQSDTKRLQGTYLDFKNEGLSFEKIVDDIDFYLIGENATPVPEGERCPKCGSRELIQDPDVLDTWFSSALWPFSTLGWPQQTKDLQVFYPTSVLVTAFDILFFWVARMIMMGLKFMNDVPFKDVYIHALVRDSKGQKMSKSKGNVIDPLIIMEKYGTDAFRFTLAALAAQGRDIKLSEDRIEGYRHFANKIWNASRFVLMNLKRDIDFSKPELNECHLFDIWILQRLNETIKDVKNAYDSYSFNEAANSIYKFLWNDFCDWYIELSKQRINETVVQKTLWFTLINALKLMHPIMPFITEEIFQKLPNHEESIVISKFPEIDDNVSKIDVKIVETFINVVRAIRNVKSEMNVGPSLKPKVLVLIKSSDKTGLKNFSEYIQSQAKCEVEFIETQVSNPRNLAYTVVEDIDIWVNLEGMIDVNAEIKRIEKEISKVEKDVTFLNKRLANEDYLKNAPQEVVDDDKVRLKGFIEKLNKLRDNMKILRDMR